ncbi:uncharacterized protein LOC131869329 [Cryptomeria japonica]|uniref:uncharacterized protein LOC131869329 n=1 Tax=Cryptomeria japonica TaxID=3369 RepID=UPI0027DA32F3|nr:uncharacterized protein LOC131869329 [Cryptomeria japonica]
MGHVDISEFLHRIAKGGGRSILSHSMPASGLVEAIAFPLSLQSVDLVVQCAQYYDEDERKIIGTLGDTVLDISPQMIQRVFCIPQYTKYECIDWIVASNYYENKNNKASKFINERLILESTRNVKKLARGQHRAEFKEEAKDYITLLSRVYENNQQVPPRSSPSQQFEDERRQQQREYRRAYQREYRRRQREEKTDDQREELRRMRNNANRERYGRRRGEITVQELENEHREEENFSTNGRQGITEQSPTNEYVLESSPYVQHDNLNERMENNVDNHSGMLQNVQSEEKHVHSNEANRQIYSRRRAQITEQQLQNQIPKEENIRRRDSRRNSQQLCLYQIENNQQVPPRSSQSQQFENERRQQQREYRRAYQREY